MRLAYFMGERDLASVRLTTRERATLAAAAALLDRLRELREDADDDLTVDVAMAGHTCRELASASEWPNP